MTPAIDLEGLRALLRVLLDAATPGIWTFDGNCGGYIADNVGVRIARAYANDDSALIVAAVNALPALLAQAEGAPEMAAEMAKLDAVVHALGIEDSEDDPEEAIRELQQTASERDHFNRLAFVDVGTGAETWKERAEKAEAEVARLRAEVARIADDYHPSRPQEDGQALSEMREALLAAVENVNA